VRKSIIAAVGATALFAVVGGSVAYANKSKTVTVSVDGQVQKVHTFGSTVADALAAKKIQVGQHDLVAPALDAKLEDGQEIAVQYGRQLTVTADGDKKQFWTTADSVNQALADLGLHYDGAQLSTSRSAPIGRQGLDLVVRIPKTVQFVRQGKVVSVKLVAMTVREAITGAKVGFDGNDRVTPALATPLRAGVNRISIVKVDVKNVTKVLAVAFGSKVTKSASLYVGDTKTTTKGVAGRRSVGYVLTYLDGKLASTKAVTSKVVTKPVTQLVTVGTKAKPAPTSTSAPTKPAAPPAPSTGDTSAWDRIAACESGGNWSVDSGNGYYGGLQFDHGTWVAYGGDAYANNANLASKSQQIAIAEKVKADRGGYGAWPVCGQKA
jgi:uncharacterized protein YabE (DUF348 family)